MENLPTNQNLSSSAKKEFVLKLDSRNRITLKDPKADFYRAEVNLDGVITLKPCVLQRLETTS